MHLNVEPPDAQRKFSGVFEPFRLSPLGGAANTQQQSYSIELTLKIFYDQIIATMWVSVTKELAWKNTLPELPELYFQTLWYVIWFFVVVVFFLEWFPETSGIYWISLWMEKTHDPTLIQRHGVGKLWVWLNMLHAGGGDVVVGGCFFSPWTRSTARWGSVTESTRVGRKSKQKDVCFKDCLQYELAKHASDREQHDGCEQVCWHACFTNTQQAWCWTCDLKAIKSNPWLVDLLKRERSCHNVVAQCGQAAAVPWPRPPKLVDGHVFASLPFLTWQLDFQLLFSHVSPLTHSWPLIKSKPPTCDMCL